MVLNLKCPSCGGVAAMDKKTGKVTCTQCGNIVNVQPGDSENSAMVRTEDGRLVDKRSYRDIRKAARIRRYITEPVDTIYTQAETEAGMAENEPRYMSVAVYECTSCGARLMVNSSETASFCAYCGQPMVLTDRVSDEWEPDCIIPFSISRESAESLIRGRFCSGWFVPREIKKLQVDKIREVYIPYFLTTVHVREKMKLAKHRKARRYAYTGYSLDDIPDDYIERKVNFRSSNNVECVMARIPCDASLKLADNISERLEPYDWGKLVPFAPEYLSGCYADKFDVPPSVIVERTKRRAGDMLIYETQEYERKYGFTTFFDTLTEAEYKLIDMEYALLPAWFMTFTYKGRQYTAAVNGQTGKVVGSVPANKAKIWTVFAVLTVLLCIACTGITVLLAYLLSVMMEWEKLNDEFPLQSVGAFCLCLVVMLVFCGFSGYAGVRRFRKAGFDLHKFRSESVITYVKGRQDKTWYR